MLISTITGVVFLAYRENCVRTPLVIDISERELRWHAATVPGMLLAELASDEHQLALFNWDPGTSVPMHSNSNGEEVLVLEGELIVSGKTLSAGTWVRLESRKMHDSAAAQSALIYLRSGHLKRKAVLKSKI